MDAFKFITMDGVCGRFDPVGNDRFKITTYPPVGNSAQEGANLAANISAHYSGMAPVPGDVNEALEVPTMHFAPTMHFEKPAPKVEKPKQESHTPHWDRPMTLNEEPLALPSMGW